jgi:hypothetical protein
MTKFRKWRFPILIGSGILAAAALIYFANGRVNSEKTQGAIGKRDVYRDGQVDAANVGATPGTAPVAMQAILDSKEFKALAKDQAFQGLMASHEFQAVARDQAFVSLLSNANFAQMAQNSAFTQLLQSDQFRKALAQSHTNEMNAQSHQESQKQELGRFDMSFAALKQDAHFQALERNQAFINLVQNSAFRSIARNQAFVNLMVGSSFQAMMRDNAFRGLISQSHFQNALLSGSAANLAFGASAVNGGGTGSPR